MADAEEEAGRGQEEDDAAAAEEAEPVRVAGAGEIRTPDGGPASEESLVGGQDGQLCLGCPVLVTIRAGVDGDDPGPHGQPAPGEAGLVA